MRTSVKLRAIELFDKELAGLQKSTSILLARTPREGWVRSIRKSLGMSMRSLAQRLRFKEPSSVKELELNERAGTVTLQTLKRAAEALDADFVYAIVPRQRLRDIIDARAREVAKSRVTAVAKSMALEEQGLSKAEIARQLDELARELTARPEILWR